MKAHLVAFLIAGTITTFVFSAPAQTSAPSPRSEAQTAPDGTKVPPMKMANGQRSPFGMPPGVTLPSFGWTKEAWAGSDKPFVALRQKLDAEAKQRKGKASLLGAWVNRYGDQARRNPKDAKAQFAWGYSATAAQRNGWNFKRGYGLPRSISLALAEPSSPKSYQYDRVRFVVAMRWQQMEKMGDLALRLLKRNPDDYEVQFYSISALFFGTPQQRQEALRIARQIEQKRPNTTVAYYSLGTAYWGLFMSNRRRADGDKAIEYIQKQISLSPKNYSGRAASENLIQTIRQRQAELGYLRG